MQYTEALAQINWLAVVVATLVAFVIGGVWYSPKVFGDTWKSLLGKKATTMNGTNLTHLMGYAFALTFISLVVLAVVMYAIGSSVLSAGQGLLFGLIVGAGLVAVCIGINYTYEQRRLKLWLINSGYIVTYFAVAGMIIGAWR